MTSQEKNNPKTSPSFFVDMKHADAATSVGLFIASFGVYIRSLAPSLLSGDSAEFQTIGYTLGVGHPTGYSVYILLAKLFTFLPINNIAYRVNLLSAFCAALTVVFVFLILRKLGAWIIPSVFGAISLALTPLFWGYSTMAEVNIPASACLAFIILAIITWKASRELQWLFLAGLVGGMSMGIHTTVALSGIAILFFLILSNCKQKEWLYAALGTLIGVMIFVASFLLLDRFDSPAGYYNVVVRPSLSVWNMSPVNFDSPLERLSFLYFPPQFREQFFAVPPDEVFSHLVSFASGVSGRVFHSAIGVVFLLIPRKDSPWRWREAILLVIALITFIIFASTYNIYDFYTHFIPAILILAILIGLGVQAILFAVTLVRRIPRFVPTVLGFVFLFSGVYSNLENLIPAWQDRIPPGLGDWEIEQYRFPDARRLEAERIVTSLEDNAILFTDWDRVYGYYYAAHIEQGRTHMDFHETYPQEGVHQLANSAVEYIEANIGTRPIYFSDRPSELTEKYMITRTDSGLYKIEKK